MNRTYSQQFTAAVPVNLAVETAIVVTNPVSVTYDFDQINITGSIDVLTGANTSLLTVRCRRGNGVNGAIVGAAVPVTAGAGVQAALPVDFLDTPGAVAGQVYTITVQATGATVNGSATPGEITVTVGS